MTSITTDASSSPESKPSEVKKEEKKVWEGRTVAAFILVGAVTIVALTVLYEIGLICYETAHDKWSRLDYVSLEKAAREKYSDAIVNIVKKFDKIDQNRVIKRLALSHDDEKNLILHLEENYEISKEQLQEILLGAHVLLDDEGEAYGKWSTELSQAKEGISSHPSNGKQYRVQGELIKELLFSKREMDNKVYTWFQLENHPVSIGHIFRHAVDYLSYKIDGQNRGPDGSSSHTDKKPLQLKKKGG